MIDAPLMPNALALAVVHALLAAGWPHPDTLAPFAADVAHATSVCAFEAACEVPNG
jgi:hypothetical protein